MNSVEHRLTRIERELAVQRLIVRYGMAVDCNHIEAALACHTEDATYIVSAARPDMPDLILRGHEEIGAMLRGELHQSLLPDAAHTVGPAILTENTDAQAMHLSATGYSRLYHAGILMRVAVNHWRFTRRGEDWLISERTSRVVGEDGAQKLLRDYFSETSTAG